MEKEKLNDLTEELKRKTNAEIRFDDGSKALYATDGSNYRQIPVGVVVPREIEDVIQTVRLCNEYDLPLLSRGCGTSLAGQCCNSAVIMDFSKYLNHIIELDSAGKYAWIEPGIVLDSLRNAAEEHHLTFGPDPSTHSHCTLGGMIGNNSCGVHSVMAGKTVDNIEELDILTYDGMRMNVKKTDDGMLESIIREGGRKGEIYSRMKALRDKYAGLIRQRYPKIPRRVSGYNLDSLLPEMGFDVAKALVGSESTCVVVLGAKCRLVDSPPERSLVVLGYDSVYHSADHVPEILEFGPIGLEGIDNLLIKYMDKKGMDIKNRKLLPQGKGFLLVEFGADTREESDAKAKRLMSNLKRKRNAPFMKLYDDKLEEEMVWKVREGGLGATAHVPGLKSTWPGWEDSAVSPNVLGDYLREFRKLMHRFGYETSLYGHFGQGCLHCRIPFDIRTSDGIETFKRFMFSAAELVHKFGGSNSGEHGDGQARGELLGVMYGTELLDAFREFKSIWDPGWRMNPGKLIDAYHLDQNLRLGTSYAPPEKQTHFRYPKDHWTFANAALRCVGIANCRREGGGTMCPSYMVTHEEMHSTRGRARLLFEMMQGDVIKDGWKSKPVHEALDLCLACKGCKGDCPVNVDMATYKAEFYSHFYKGRLRPMHAYSMGLIYWWAKVGSKMPGAANFFTHAPVINSIVKFLGGISPERDIPMFAEETFRHWYFKNKRQETFVRPRVILWPDTFNNNFYPANSIAAFNVLEKLGYDVIIPGKSLCCGRPLYDFGMLNTAKKLLRETLDYLRPEIRQGIPLIGIEPSCTATFRDELVNIYPNDEDAKRLSAQTYLLSEFLTRKVSDLKLPKVNKKAIVHGHCHHKAVFGMGDEEEVLKKLGLDFKILDSGCCGMAGSFGFEKDKFDISVKVGERVLLPKVREADHDTIVIANGFSCREQIRQLTSRKALTLSELLYLAMGNEMDIEADKMTEQVEKELMHQELLHH